MILDRLRPADWAWALRAGLESVGLGWLLVVLTTVAVALSSSGLDAAAALGVGDGLRTGTALWSLGFGGRMGQAFGPDGALGLPLLGLTALQAVWTWNCVRRARPTTIASGAWIVASSAATAVLACLTGPAWAQVWPAVAGIAALTAAVVALRLRREGVRHPVLTRLWQARPHWVSPGLSLARGATRALGILTALVLIAAIIGGAGRVSHLHDSVAGGGIMASLGLIALQAGWLPTAAVWACSWLVGAGFAVGHDSVFAPDRVVPGPVPGLPLLGLLPTTPMGTAGIYLPLVVTAGAMVAAWRRRRVLYALRVRHAVAAALLASAVVALGMGALCLAASGPVGPGRMATTGPQLGYAVLFVFLEVAAGLGAIAVLSHPYTLSLASGAASGARSRMEESVETAVESARERRASRGAAAAQPAPGGDEDDGDDGYDGDPHDSGHDAPERSPDPAPRRGTAPWSDWRRQAARAEGPTSTRGAEPGKSAGSTGDDDD
ncbi:DUF6350 domain-containing protein [Actinomyces slackii]|uniref:cell division protein PerM n=1 Tax=Actinomyces slackii TaxID=52774 RepID=UPI0039EC8E6E